MKRIIEEAEPPETTPKQHKKQSEVEESFYILSKPMILTNYFVNKPGMSLIIAGIIIVFCIAVDLAFDYFTPSIETNRDFLIWDDIRTI